MFPRYRGRPGAGRGLVLAALALMAGTAVLLTSDDRPEAGTSRLEATQGSVWPLGLDADEAPVVDDGPATPAPPAGDTAGVEAVAPSTTTPEAVASTGEPTPDPLPAATPAEDAAGALTTTVAASPPADSATTTTPPSTTPMPVARAAAVVTTITTTTTTAPAPTGPVRTASAEAEVVPLTNRDRAGEGLGSLTRSACLDSVASRYAEQMARSGVLAHNPGAGAAVTGCRPGATWGDNVGTTAPCDTARMEREWMVSPSHRRNILGGAFKLIGVGAWTDEQGGCWVQVLFSS